MSTPTRHLFTKIAAVKKTLHLNLATCLAVMLHYQSLKTSVTIYKLYARLNQVRHFG